ncbi:MAG TPA: hypothetical protein VFZ86_02360 [Thermoleophilia bacterium]|nr:hypothetical protein [Thermoleophilia bacterium]
MSHTIAHRPHVHHLPLAPVVALIAIVLIAAVVIWAVGQPAPTTTTTTVGASIVSPVVHPAAVAAPESPVFRHALMRVNGGDGYPLASIVGRYHMVEGATLDPVSTNPYGTASYKAPHYPR